MSNPLCMVMAINTTYCPYITYRLHENVATASLSESSQLLQIKAAGGLSLSLD